MWQGHDVAHEDSASKEYGEFEQDGACLGLIDPTSSRRVIGAKASWSWNASGLGQRGQHQEQVQ